MHIISIILARGGSKGIPRKNLINFCGKPLLQWTIEQCQMANGIDSVWVSSDDHDILELADKKGTRIIRRPDSLAGDHATSESGWLHAIDTIEKTVGTVDFVVAPQVTSPLRESGDIEKAITLFKTNQFDSMFSCSVAEDLYFWQRDKNGQLDSLNYDWRNRKRRQEHAPEYIENGSFYLFKPEVLRRFNNRFGERIGMVEMEFWKTFEIDSPETLQICSALMKEFLLSK